MLLISEDCYVFGQEYAPAGDLFDIIPPQVHTPPDPPVQSEAVSTATSSTLRYTRPVRSEAVTTATSYQGAVV